MLLYGSTETERALRAVGEILEARGHAYAAVVVGGGALNLLGVVDRPTRDVDIMVFGEPPTDPSPKLIAPPQDLPEPLAQAVELTAATSAYLMIGSTRGLPCSGCRDCPTDSTGGSRGDATVASSSASPVVEI